MLYVLYVPIANYAIKFVCQKKKKKNIKLMNDRNIKSVKEKKKK
jgi:hypothetical protein